MNVVKEFEKLTGCKVNYTNYESNENMYSKLIGGGFLMTLSFRATI